MGRWRSLSVVAGALAIVAVGVWVGHGSQVYTKTSRQVTVKDELFGTESIRWEPSLQVGLDIAGPTVALCAGLCGFGIYRSRRSGRA